MMIDSTRGAGTAQRIDWSPFSALSSLLLYPTERLSVDAARCKQDPTFCGVAVDSEMEAALEAFESLPLHELEELYTQTFDLNPVCTLEVGWHLYGEQYERGRFLVRTRDLLRQVGIDEGGELPDFLPSLLRSLPLIESNDAQDVGAYLVPALRRMCSTFGDQEAAPGSAIYSPILNAVLDALEERVPQSAIDEAETRFRPLLEGGRPRGFEPGPNGDFPFDVGERRPAAANPPVGANGSDVDPAAPVKLGVPGKFRRPGSVTGFSREEFVELQADGVKEATTSTAKADQPAEECAS